jgi:phosphatidylserine/phosphatidylglycerophosphate/cardiolipin synthase-like enzyme
VQQALKRFEADRGRQPYEVAKSGLVVSPENARAALGQFIQKAKRQLLIWDPKVVDPQMLKLLNERAKKGVDVRVLGKVGKKADFPHDKLADKRLHVRAMIRDGRDAFIGSQSLRKLELDSRREVGIIVRNAAVVREMLSTFAEDWAATDTGRKASKKKQRGSDIAIFPEKRTA